MKGKLLGNIFKQKKTPYYTAIDLGSSAIRVAVFEPADEQHESRIIGMGSQIQGRKSMYAGQITNLDAVTDSLKLALDEATLKSDSQSNQVVLGLSGGMIHVRGLRVRTKRSHPTEILTEKEFEVIAQKIEEKTLNKALQELQAKCGSELTRVETSFTGFEVDGARVSTPIGLAGNEIEVAVLHYFIDQTKLNTINALIDQFNLEIVSLIETSVQAAVDLSKDGNDFILLDVGGDSTEVVVVVSGKVVGNEVLFIGGNDITWQIQQDLNTSYDNAENLKLEYAQGHLDQDRGRMTKHSIETALEIWVEGIASALSEFKVNDLPPRLIISGESRHLSEIKSRLSAYPWTKFLHFVNFPKIETISGKLPNIEALTRVEL
ncbi:hypothetical protein HGA91_01290 [candidate division WWE3 bacterium]|nr:hypothetical protein [candidate division WWE3 bacterium]